MTSFDSKVEGIAVQLQPADAKVLADALKQGSPGTNKIIWLAAPDNALVGTLRSGEVESNIDRAGVIGLYAGNSIDEPIIKYLMTKVHLE